MPCPTGLPPSIIGVEESLLNEEIFAQFPVSTTVVITLWGPRFPLLVVAGPGLGLMLAAPLRPGQYLFGRRQPVPHQPQQQPPHLRDRQRDQRRRLPRPLFCGPAARAACARIT